MKLWYHSKSGKAPGANNGTSKSNAWNHKDLWTVARKFIKFVPLFLLCLLLTGCWSDHWGNMPWTSKGVSVVPSANKAEAPAFPTEPAVVVSHQPMGYETQTNGCTWVNLTNGPNSGKVIGPFCDYPVTNMTMAWDQVSYYDTNFKQVMWPNLEGTTNLTSWYFVASPGSACRYTVPISKPRENFRLTL